MFSKIFVPIYNSSSNIQTYCLSSSFSTFGIVKLLNHFQISGKNIISIWIFLINSDVLVSHIQVSLFISLSIKFMYFVHFSMRLSFYVLQITSESVACLFSFGKLFNGYRVSDLKDEKVLESGHTTMWMHLILLSCTLRNGNMVSFMLFFTTI